MAPLQASYQHLSPANSTIAVDEHMCSTINNINKHSRGRSHDPLLIHIVNTKSNTQQPPEDMISAITDSPYTNGVIANDDIDDDCCEVDVDLNSDSFGSYCDDENDDQYNSANCRGSKRNMIISDRVDQILNTPRRTESILMKSVHFAPAIVHACFIESHKEFSKKERLRCWYSALEKEKMMSRHEKVVIRMEQGKPPKTTKQTYRGLESWTTVGATLLDNAINTCINSVMDEQDRQWHSNENDFELIAACSLQVTSDSKDRARQVGINDEEAAKAVLSLEWTADDEMSVSVCMSARSRVQKKVHMSKVQQRERGSTKNIKAASAAKKSGKKSKKEMTELEMFIAESKGELIIDDDDEVLEVVPKQSETKHTSEKKKSSSHSHKKEKKVKTSKKLSVTSSTTESSKKKKSSKKSSSSDKSDKDKSDKETKKSRSLSKSPVKGRDRKSRSSNEETAATEPSKKKERTSRSKSPVSKKKKDRTSSRSKSPAKRSCKKTTTTSPTVVKSGGDTTATSPVSTSSTLMINNDEVLENLRRNSSRTSLSLSSHSSKHADPPGRICNRQKSSHSDKILQEMKAKARKAAVTTATAASPSASPTKSPPSTKSSGAAKKPASAKLEREAKKKTGKQRMSLPKLFA